MQIRIPLLTAALLLINVSDVIADQASQSEDKLSTEYEHLQTLRPGQCSKEIHKDLLAHLPAHRAYMNTLAPVNDTVDEVVASGSDLTGEEAALLKFSQELVCGPDEENLGRQKRNLIYKEPYPDNPRFPQPRMRLPDVRNTRATEGEDLPEAIARLIARRQAAGRMVATTATTAQQAPTFLASLFNILASIILV